MPHHAPAENSAATATRPSTALNPGRELAGSESWLGNDRMGAGCVSGVSSSIADGVSKVSSATLSSGNLTKSAGIATGSCASTVGPGTTTGTISGTTFGTMSGTM